MEDDDKPMTRKEFRADLKKFADQITTELSGQIRVLGVAIEGIDCKLDLVIEAVSHNSVLIKGLTDKVEVLEEDMLVVKSVVRENSKEIRRNSVGIRQNRDEIRKVHKVIENHEKRITKLETQAA